MSLVHEIETTPLPTELKGGEAKIILNVEETRLNRCFNSCPQSPLKYPIENGVGTTESQTIDERFLEINREADKGEVGNTESTVSGGKSPESVINPDEIEVGNTELQSVEERCTESHKNVCESEFGSTDCVVSGEKSSEIAKNSISNNQCQVLEEKSEEIYENVKENEVGNAESDSITENHNECEASTFESQVLEEKPPEVAKNLNENEVVTHKSEIHENISNSEDGSTESQEKSLELINGPTENSVGNTELESLDEKSPESQITEEKSLEIDEKLRDVGNTESMVSRGNSEEIDTDFDENEICSKEFWQKSPESLDKSLESSVGNTESVVLEEKLDSAVEEKSLEIYKKSSETEIGNTEPKVFGAKSQEIDKSLNENEIGSSEFQEKSQEIIENPNKNSVGNTECQALDEKSPVLSNLNEDRVGTTESRTIEEVPLEFNENPNKSEIGNNDSEVLEEKSPKIDVTPVENELLSIQEGPMDIDEAFNNEVGNTECQAFEEKSPILSNPNEDSVGTTESQTIEEVPLEVNKNPNESEIGNINSGVLEEKSPEVDGNPVENESPSIQRVSLENDTTFNNNEVGSTESSSIHGVSKDIDETFNENEVGNTESSTSVEDNLIKDVVDNEQILENHIDSTEFESQEEKSPEIDQNPNENGIGYTECQILREMTPDPDDENDVGTTVNDPEISENLTNSNEVGNSEALTEKSPASDDEHQRASKTSIDDTFMTGDVTDEPMDIDDSISESKIHISAICSLSDPNERKETRKNGRTIVCSGCPAKTHTLKGYRLFHTVLYRASEWQFLSQRSYNQSKQSEDEDEDEETPETHEEVRPGREVRRRKRPIKPWKMTCQGWLKRHEKNKRTRKPPVCPECYEMFNTIAQLVEHFKSYHDLECAKCDESFGSFTDFWRHKAEHGKPRVLWNCQRQLYECSDCPRTYNNPLVMTRHVKRHRSVNVNVEGNGGRKMAKCEQCSFVTHIGGLNGHRKVHKKEGITQIVSLKQSSDDSEESQDLMPIVDKARIVPKKGGRNLGQYASRFDHDRQMFQCDQCPRAVGQLDTFQSHMKGHSSCDRSLTKCIYCNYRCNAMHIKNHEKVHERFAASQASGIEEPRGVKRKRPNRVRRDKKEPPVQLESVRKVPLQVEIVKKDVVPLETGKRPLKAIRMEIVKVRSETSTDEDEDVDIAGCYDRAIHQYRCPKCPFVVPVRVRFQGHLKRHSRSHDPTFVSCQFCSFSCNPRSIKKHEAMHRARIPDDFDIDDYCSRGVYSCTECPRKTKEPAIFEQHLRMHVCELGEGMVQCGFCSFKAKRPCMHKHTKLHLKEHQMKKRKTKSPDIVDEEDKKIKCQYCSFRCDSREMGGHIKHHFKFGEELTVTVTDDSNGRQSEGCRGDDSVLDDSDRTRIIEEMQSFYDAYEQLYKCPECPRISREPLVFADHWRGHTITDEALSRCDFCSFRAKPNHLSNHMKMHAKMPPPSSPPMLDYYGKSWREREEDEGEEVAPPPKRLRMDRPLPQQASKVKSHKKVAKREEGPPIEIVDLCDDDDDLFMVSSTTFVCPVCQFESPTHDGLQTHKCKVSKVFPCDFCKFQTKYGKCLAKHMKLHHPGHVDENEEGYQ